ncbi:hypothetical protein [Natranaerofaba carboxydovora]|uniref:Kae1-like domain-containing protein n=1 Tax=Natranaerofaba carboxydovora TaxID=2742683 RepID=UPI001F131987|nr:hypothetical protein [Natranaerofaba carboxydovora]UMZ73951.1 tRNA N6-adenosine threonylcarbamoyltransferase [Natranaerofaba carboxydovora]
MIYLGIDTSAYTTSLALFCGDKLYKKEKVLEVQEGQKGLRQSEAVFQHQKNLPVLFDHLMDYVEKENKIKVTDIKAIGASTAPRPVRGSYMPVFVTGTSYAKVLSRVLNIDFLTTTHQENHLACSFYYNNTTLDDFLALHISGGTTELLKVKFNNYKFDIKLLGETEDISAGQYIDRVGVKLGYKFPSGVYLEELSKKATMTESVPVAVNDSKVSFSGPLSHVERKLEKDNLTEIEKANIARGVFDNISQSIEKLISNVRYPKNIKNIILVGGVMSNKYIKNYLQKNLKEYFNLRTCYTPPELSKDNACGVAWLTKQKFEKQVFKK